MKGTRFPKEDLDLSLIGAMPNWTKAASTRPLKPNKPRYVFLRSSEVNTNSSAGRIITSMARSKPLMPNP